MSLSAQALRATRDVAAKSTKRLPHFIVSKNPIVCPSIPPQKPEHEGKLTVVLDIDETLVHTYFSEQVKAKVKYNAETGSAEPDTVLHSDFFQINIENCVANVYKRPNLDWFLKEASKKFELITFTAGIEDYGRQVLKGIDSEKSFITHSLFRHNCSNCYQGFSQLFTKDLNILNRPLNRTVLVDNNPICFVLQPENGIPIRSYYAEAEDSDLKYLMSMLDLLSKEPDVRPLLRQKFKLHDHMAQSMTQAAL